MVASKVRLERLAQEQRFRDWLFLRRLIETLPEREFALFVSHGYFVNPLPPLKSSLDGLDHKSLIELWEEDDAKHRREHAGKSEAELAHYTRCGHWPESTCGEDKCRCIVDHCPVCVVRIG